VGRRLVWSSVGLMGLKLGCDYGFALNFFGEGRMSKERVPFFQVY